ncbi:MAG: DUF6036 family nucleotidyltransferase [Candidatus Hydrothermarchaeales archaeon]
MRTLEELVKDITKILEEQKIEYVIVGGVAVAGWGNIRTTRDVDIIINLKEKQIKPLESALKKEELDATEDEIKEALREKTHFTIFDKKSEYHIDAKGYYTEKEKRSLETKKAVKLWGKKIYIASPEDIIANKLVFGSQQDIKDAEGILVRQTEKLNHKYLEEICKEMGVHGDLEKLKIRVNKIIPKKMTNLK